MKKLAVLFSLFAFGLLLSGCAGLAGPREVALPLAKLQAGVERRFPLQNRLLDLFDVRLTSPQVQMLPDSGRVGLAMDASVAPPFIRQSWQGRMALSGRLYIDAVRGQVLMAEPRVDRFDIDGVDPGRQRQLEKVANLLMEQIVSEIPVYSFRPDELRFAGLQFVPTRLRTTSSGLVVTLEPIK
jgi:hypothetical protein